MYERLTKRFLGSNAPYTEFTDNEILNRLCEIEDKICEGKIVELPCSVGQTVYAVSNYYGGEWRIYECRVDNFTVYKTNTFMSISDREGYNFGANICEIGKTVFLIPEEANKKLKELENEQR